MIVGAALLRAALHPSAHIAMLDGFRVDVWRAARGCEGDEPLLDRAVIGPVVAESIPLVRRWRDDVELVRLASVIVVELKTYCCKPPGVVTIEPGLTW